MVFKVRNYVTPHFSVEDPKIQIGGFPAPYAHGCHGPLVTRGTLGYVPYQKGVTQGHSYSRSPAREALSLCSGIMFQAVIC